MSDYISLNSDKMKEKMDLMINLWLSFLKKTISAYIEENNSLGQSCEALEKCNVEDIYDVNVMGLREIFERTHQREDYFKRYHKDLKMSNFKEIGLLAFWISKLKPFHIKANYFDEYFNLKVNEEFALYFMFNAIARYAKEQNCHYSLKRLNPELYNELLYTMLYRDLSKEAFGCIVELLFVATSVV